MKTDPGSRDWIAARQRHRLSHAYVQMARELGMNPRKLGGLDNHHQEPWKLPLSRFIEELYEKRFGRARPAVVLSIEDRAKEQARKNSARKAVRAERRAGASTLHADRGEAPTDEPQESAGEARGRPAQPNDSTE